jgi:hypothetical protein
MANDEQRARAAADLRRRRLAERLASSRPAQSPSESRRPASAAPAPSRRSTAPRRPEMDPELAIEMLTGRPPPNYLDDLRDPLGLNGTGPAGRGNGGAGNLGPGRASSGPPRPATPRTAVDLARALAPFIRQTESAGRHYDEHGKVLTSSKGAKGWMQIRGSTGAKPGYGVPPMRNDTPAENLRFGTDYALGLLRNFETDPVQALASYNWGPGHFNRAVSEYGNAWIDQAPPETLDYLARIFGKLGRPSRDGGPTRPVTIPT